MSGPAATTRATHRALAKVDNARADVLVESISDQIAVKTAAVGTTVTHRFARIVPLLPAVLLSGSAGATVRSVVAGGFVSPATFGDELTAVRDALLPQFIPHDAPAFAFGAFLACVHIILGTTWSAIPVVLAHRLRTALQRPAARRLMDRVTETIIIGFGLRLVTSSH